MAAGEAQDPQTSVPKAIRTTVVRLALFFVGTIFRTGDVAAPRAGGNH
ncbi:hypothetical protein ACFS4T_17305 [Pseudomonas lini]